MEFKNVLRNNKFPIHKFTEAYIFKLAKRQTTLCRKRAWTTYQVFHI